LLFTSLLEDAKDIPHGKEGYIFLGADEAKAVEYLTEITKTLFELGKVKSPEPQSLGEDEAAEHYGPYVRIYVSLYLKSIGLIQ